MNPPSFFKTDKETQQENISSLKNFVNENCKELTEEEESILEKNLVWVFASPRSGTTWLVTQLLTYNTNQLDEPYIGAHIGGPFNIEVLGKQPSLIIEHKNRPDYFFSDKYDKAWKFYSRKYILNRIHFQFKELNKKIIIKEPNGLEGAEAIMECFPQSKIIIVLRDGRDILDSMVDARSEFSARGGWLSDKAATIPKVERIPFLVAEAEFWLTRMKILKKIYENHSKNLVHFVKYEDLRKHTFQELKDIYEFLEIEIDDLHRLQVRVEKFDFDRIPEEDKGKGKPARSASPGKWKENFSEEEKIVVEEIIGDTLHQLGYV